MGAGQVGGQTAIFALTIETAAHRVKIRKMSRLHHYSVMSRG